MSGKRYPERLNLTNCKYKTHNNWISLVLIVIVTWYYYINKNQV
jgi:hypothetical protein